MTRVVASFALAGTFLLASANLRADEIVTELFEYDPGELDLQEEGTGDWVAPWFAVPDLTEVIDTADTPLTFGVPGGGVVTDGGRALEMLPNDDNIVYRELDYTDLDDVYISFLFRFTGEVSDNDFMGLWLDEFPSGTHPDAPSIGFKAQEGGGGTLDIFSRIALGGEAYTEDIVPGDTYFVVGHLYKEIGGAAEAYTNFDLWVNPGIDDIDVPEASALGFGRNFFTHVGIRVPNFGAGDVALLAALRLGTEWEDVVPEAAPGQELCENAMDDDGDGLADCADPDCADFASCKETCDNNADDDGDGLADCEDPDCADHPVCQAQPCAVVRTLSKAWYQGGDRVTVTLTASEIQGASQIVETVPAGWTISANPAGGTVAGNMITFDIATDGEVSYEVTAPDGVCESVLFEGTVSGEGNCAGNVVGSASLSCTTPGEIATELFDYDPGELDGEGGGTGDWFGDWLAVVDLTEIVDTSDDPLEYEVPGGGTVTDGERALELLPNDDNIVSRELEIQDGDHVFVSFLFRFTGFVDDNDFMGISFDEANTGTHPDAPSIGFKGNQNGGGPLDMFSRIALNGEAYAEDILPDETYFVVGHLFKEVSGADQPYTNFDLWVNPAFDDPPHASATGSGRTFFNFVSIRVPNFALDDVALISAFHLGTSWEDVVPSGEVAAGQPFIRGDADASGGVNITDAVFVLNHLFGEGDVPPCNEAANADGQGGVNITDGVYILNFLFGSGAEPVAPYPDCGVVEGADCAAFGPCM